MIEIPDQLEPKTLGHFVLTCRPRVLVSYRRTQTYQRKPGNCVNWRRKWHTEKIGPDHRSLTREIGKNDIQKLADGWETA